MAKGSFNGLYTFEDIAKIYRIDSSTLRKMVQYEKFIIDKEIKKFGKTWIITEEAISKHFGLSTLLLYNKELSLQMLREKREEKIKKAALKSANKKVRVNKNNNTFDCSDDDDVVEELREIIVDDRLVIKSFDFNK